MKLINTLRFSLLAFIFVTHAASADIIGIAGTSTASDNMGVATAAGDFNCDTYDDLVAHSSGTGQFNVIYGGTGSGNRLGIPGNYQFSMAVGAITMATGDFDGNGCDDLAIGRPGDNVGSAAAAGQVFIMYGDSSGLLHMYPEVWNQNTGGVADSAETNDAFGASLAAGDFNGDSYADLAIGVPGENSNAGAVYTLHGQPLAGLTTFFSALFSQNSSGIAGGSESGDSFGYALASGYFNNDGYADLAIGVPGEMQNGLDDSGVVHVLYGSGSSVSGSGSQMWYQGAGGVPSTLGEDKEFGISLAAGDFNNNGRDDLAIGVRAEYRWSDPYPYPSGICGAIHVLYGTSGGISSTGNQFFQSSVMEECNTGFGQVLATGDFNNDNRDELVLGLPTDYVDGANLDRGGSALIFLGSSSGLSGMQSLHQDSPGADGEVEWDDRFGHALAVGDFDNNGSSDLAVGVPDEVYSGIESGVVQVFYGQGSYGFFAPFIGVTDDIFVQ